MRIAMTVLCAALSVHHPPLNTPDICKKEGLYSACAKALPKLLLPQLPPEHPPQPWEEVCAEQTPRVPHKLLLDSAQQLMVCEGWGHSTASRHTASARTQRQNTPLCKRSLRSWIQCMVSHVGPKVGTEKGLL